MATSNNRKRTQKFYAKNERKVMEALGLEATAASGAGWVDKEDGENEHILAQLKSTDSATLSIKMRDWDNLVLNSNIAHKIPIFVNQKLGNNGVTLISMRPEDIPLVAKYLECGEVEIPGDKDLAVMVDDEPQPKRRVIKSGNARKLADKRNKDNEKKYGKRW